MAKYTETLGYIIHTRPFKNSSLIIEFFSQEFGMMHLLAKGIKKNKQYKTQIQFFNPVKIQFFGKSNLKTLSSINALTNRRFSNLVDKMAAMYLNELIHLSVVEGEAAMCLFDSYQNSLQNLGKVRLSLLLRRFEFQLLKHNGFELSISQYDNPNAWLTIDENQGLITTTQESAKLCRIFDFHDFIQGKSLTKTQLTSVNKLIYSAINLNLSYKKVHAREMLKILLSK